ncbi:MAG TPA: sugar phosphate isomerase/epimerase [Kineosporiaceae bacterium]|nr:sugar phosphate isomerase/epimerase [Kineosporiaceae bacterium]
MGSPTLFDLVAVPTGRTRDEARRLHRLPARQAAPRGAEDPRRPRTGERRDQLRWFHRRAAPADQPARERDRPAGVPRPVRRRRHYADRAELQRQPLDANAARREKHSADILRSIEVAAALGVKRVVTMSGTPGTYAHATLPAWNVLPWDSAYLDVRDYQWNEVAIPFWTMVQERAAHFDVKVALEMHPHNLVYNPATLERLVTETNATHIGAELDPSHLFWQGIEPIEAVDHLGSLVFNAAAKDTRINAAARINGVLDDRFGRVLPDAPNALGLGGPFTLSTWPKNSSWDFVAVGRGHDVNWWRGFLQAIERVDPDMPVNIEHEDQELDQMDGLRSAAATLLAAAGKA